MNRSRKHATLIKLLPVLIRVWAYVRVSTAKQVRTDIREYGSLDKQASAINFFVKCRKPENWRLDNTVPDPAESGDNLDRPGLQQVLNAARKGEFEVLVIYNYDRLTRDWHHAKSILTELEECGVTVWVVSSGTTVSLHPIEEYRRALNAFGEAEVGLWKIRKQRSTDVLQMTLEGFWQGTRAPIGYRTKKLMRSRVLVIDRRLAKIIEELMKRAGDGEPVGKILADFDQKGIRTPSHRVKHGRRKKEIGCRKFTWDLVLKIVRNPLYAGFTFIRNYDPKRHAGKEPFRVLSDGTALFVAKHKGLVSIECWLKAMDALAGRERRVRKAREVDSVGKFVLQGSIWCSCCGLRMTPRGDGYGHGQYICMSVAQPSRTESPECDVRSVSAHVVEDASLTLIQRVVERPEIVDAILSHGRSISCQSRKKGSGQLNRKLKAAEGTRAKLLTAIQAVNSKGAIQALASDLDAAIARRDQIQREIDASWGDTPLALRSAAGIRSMLQNLAKVSATINRRKLKEVYRSLLQKVTISAGKSTATSRVLRIELQVREESLSKGSHVIPLRLEIEQPRRGRTYLITKPFREERHQASNPGGENEKATGHCFERLDQYLELASTMKQREIAKKVGKTPASVCQVLSLSRIPPVLRRRIVAASSAVKQVLGLNRLMALAKLPGPLQEARINAVLRPPPGLAA